MKTPSAADQNVSYVETPRGLFTVSGNWFNTTEYALNEYAGSVLAHTPIAELIKIADLWLRAPQTLALWIGLVLLWQWGIAAGLIGGLACYVIMSLWGPAMIVHTLTPVLKVLDHVLAQALGYVVFLSWLGQNGQFALLGVGLGFFVAVRWGLVDSALGSLINKIRNKIYQVPYPDQMLKSVIVRIAMKNRLALPELDKMERFILGRIMKK